ncbi:hypothetical protein CAEBREN_00115 [Caenorhabditis brenneri]|uniref:EGF-like domain-containing protein n=1 Tax=Caenorhabditis brenneri TaxID=135651 RepID=G0N454_CAEBE|nr:hypothetical protein CAEBREN_00115 [Caenorhabditis brenneri]
MNLKIPLIIGILSLFLGVSAEICSSFTNNNGATNCCTNGGYLEKNNQTCICPSGYLGVHCEAVKTSMPPDNHFKAGGTSFNIMNVNLYTQYWGVQTYQNVQKSVNAHFAAFPNGYDMYNLLETSGSPTLDSLDIPIYSYTFDKWYSKNTTFNLAENATDTGLYWCYEVPIFENLIKMIQSAKLKNTVITILTQHPPSDDKRYEAREIAVAFGIRINVLWTKDLTFNRCTDDQVQGFKTFVDVTGGLFVELQSELDDQTTIELVSQVLLTHYKPQYVAIQSFPNCTTPQTLPLVIDPTVNGPYNFVFLGVNATPSIDSYRDCFLRSPLRSTDNQLAIFQSPDPSCTSLTITSKGGSCTAIVFTNANSTAGPLDLAIYTTYVEDPSIDASRYAIIEKVPFYPAVHVESGSSDPVVLNSVAISYNIDGKATPVKRDIASYDWISSTPIQCNASQTYSLYLNISVGTTIVQRAVRVACVATPVVPLTTTSAPETMAPTTTGPSTSPAPSTSSSAPTSSAAATSSAAPAVCSPLKNYATFLFAYATDFDPSTYGILYKTIGNQLTNLNISTNQFYANGFFDSKTPKAMPINYTSNIIFFENYEFFFGKLRVFFGKLRFFFSKKKLSSNMVSTPQTPIFSRDFTTNCIVDQPVAANATDGPTGSNALQVIRDFLKSDDNPRNWTLQGRLEGSMIVILVHRLPNNDDDLTSAEYDQLTNLNVKIFPIITIKDISTTLSTGRSGAVFNRIAAQTNGHYVVANDTIGRDVNSDINKIVTNFMQTAYSKNLLFTRNIGSGRLDGSSLGTLKVPTSSDGSATVSVTITVSLSAVDSNVPKPPGQLMLGFKPASGANNTISIDFLTSDQVTRYANSNFYTTTVQLEAGIDRELILIYKLGDDSNDLLLRMWTDGNTYREATYINYDENATPSSVVSDNVPSIEENYGAALRFKLDSPSPCLTPSPASLIITDCNGVVSAKYDSKQVSSFIDPTSDTIGYFQFIPFFCSSQPSTTCITGAESKYDAQLVTDSFSITQSFQCRPGTGPSDNCKLQDANGNNQCSGVSPFHRGPSGTVYDCSNHGILEYKNDTQKFRCACESDAFTGDSCEVVSCSDPNLDPLAKDNAYHTYTIVLGLEAGTGFLTIDDANELFGLQSLTFDKLSEVWKYQLLTICADGVYMLVKYADTYRACQVPAADGVHDLTSIYQRAVQGIGRNVKGIIVYYTEASSMINVTLNDFITASQPYQQQLFVYAINEGNSPGKLLGNDSIVQAAMSTGGFLIHSFITDELTTFIDKSFIPSLLQSSSSIAWLSSSQYGNFPIVADKPTTVNYLITWGSGLELEALNNKPDPNDFKKCIYAVNASYFCKLQGDHTVLGGVASGNPFYVAVYLLDDVLAPKAQIISSLSQDSSDAVSTSTSDARTMLTFNIKPGYSVVANDGDGGITRNAGRNGCTFTNTAYSVFASQKYKPGANIAKVTIKKNSDGSKTFTRFFPFGTTSAPVCQNGGTPITSSGSCSCPSGFQGPDCSLVNCSEQSISNAWYDVCVCKSIEDATCAARYTSFF